MSYSPPAYVDTKEQAILALASTIAETDKTGLGDGSINKALDILADVMAESDVEVPQTDAGAILALAQYASMGITPTGTITLKQNGTYDVTQYASAKVNVKPTTTLTITQNNTTKNVQDYGYAKVEVPASSNMTLDITVPAGDFAEGAECTLEFNGAEYAASVTSGSLLFQNVAATGGVDFRVWSPDNVNMFAIASIKSTAAFGWAANADIYNALATPTAAGIELLGSWI